MPIHDWTKVDARIFHHFHNHWISAISRSLNGGGLPPNYYALAEQFAGDIGPDVLALERRGTASGTRDPSTLPERSEVLTVDLHPPKVSVTAISDFGHYTQKQQTLVIRHVSGDQIVALVEIISPGNKSNQAAFSKLLEKLTAALDQGYHLLILDLQPPTSRDPEGIHGALWSAIGEEDYRAPEGKPLTLASYAAEACVKAYVEPVGIGEPLCDMPLFLEPGMYVNVCLESTYQDAWEGVPLRWRREIDPLAG